MTDMVEAKKENDSVTTVCYGETRVWNSREEAEMYFLEAMRNTDGSERSRYTNVYLGIKAGLDSCTDSD